jgi:hypothetical protein
MDQQAISAFDIQQDNQELFKQYCMTYGNFFFPCRDKPNADMYGRIERVFKNSFLFSNISLVVIPFCKVNYDRSGTNEMVSRPNYVLSDADKNMPVYLNGEISLSRGGNKTKKKIKCSFKAIDVKKNSVESYNLGL